MHLLSVSISSSFQKQTKVILVAKEALQIETKESLSKFPPL